MKLPCCLLLALAAGVRATMPVANTAIQPIQPIQPTAKKPKPTTTAAHEGAGDVGATDGTPAPHQSPLHHLQGAISKVRTEVQVVHRLKELVHLHQLAATGRPVLTNPTCMSGDGQLAIKLVNEKRAALAPPLPPLELLEVISTTLQEVAGVVTKSCVKAQVQGTTTPVELSISFFADLALSAEVKQTLTDVTPESFITAAAAPTGVVVQGYVCPRPKPDLEKFALIAPTPMSMDDSAPDSAPDTAPTGGTSSSPAPAKGSCTHQSEEDCCFSIGKRAACVWDTKQAKCWEKTEYTSDADCKAKIAAKLEQVQQEAGAASAPEHVKSCFSYRGATAKQDCCGATGKNGVPCAFVGGVWDPQCRRASLLTDPTMNQCPAAAAPSPAQTQTSAGVQPTTSLRFRGGALAQADQAAMMDASLFDLITDSFDARNMHGGACREHITDNVDNQGACGCCYAFAATGAAGDRQCLFDAKRGNVAAFSSEPDRYKLSPLDVISCGKNRRSLDKSCVNMVTGTLEYADGCAGHTSVTAFQFAKDHQFVSKACGGTYPYVGNSEPDGKPRCLMRVLDPAGAAAGETLSLTTSENSRITLEQVAGGWYGEMDMSACERPSRVAATRTERWALNERPSGRIMGRRSCTITNVGSEDTRATWGRKYIVIEAGKTQRRVESDCSPPPDENPALQVRFEAEVVQWDLTDTNRVTLEKQAAARLLTQGDGTMTLRAFALSKRVDLQQLQNVNDSEKWAQPGQEDTPIPAGVKITIPVSTSDCTRREGAGGVLQSRTECHPVKMKHVQAVAGEEAMQRAILAGGTITVSLDVTPSDFKVFSASKTAIWPEGVYTDPRARLNAAGDSVWSGPCVNMEQDQRELCSQQPENCACGGGGHAVVVYGWGQTASGVKYWLGRNSWGKDWGDGGHFKVPRGVGLVERDSAAGGCIDAEDDADSPRCVSEAGNCAKSNCSPGQPCMITNSCDGDAVLVDFPGAGAYPFLLGTRKGNTCDNNRWQPTDPRKGYVIKSAGGKLEAAAADAASKICTQSDAMDPAKVAEIPKMLPGGEASAGTAAPPSSQPATPRPEEPGTRRAPVRRPLPPPEPTRPAAAPCVVRKANKECEVNNGCAADLTVYFKQGTLTTNIQNVIPSGRKLSVDEKFCSQQMGANEGDASGCLTKEVQDVCQISNTCGGTYTISLPGSMSFYTVNPGESFSAAKDYCAPDVEVKQEA